MQQSAFQEQHENTSGLVGKQFNTQTLVHHDLLAEPIVLWSPLIISIQNK